MVIFVASLIWAFTGAEKSADSVVVLPQVIDSRVSPVHVESGKDTVSGTPEPSLKAAYKTWDQSCKSWKTELKSLNKNNLLFASCGEPKKREDKGGTQRLFTYTSNASYKIKVVGP